MKPDRVHRTMNTVLLIAILAIQSIYNSPPADAMLGEQLMALGIYGALLALIFLTIHMAPEYVDEIREYAGIGKRES